MIRRLFTAFFTFLGYMTFISLIVASIVLYIGWRKNEAHIAARNANAPAPATLAIAPAEDAPQPYIEPISPTRSKPVQKKPGGVQQQKHIVASAPAAAPAAYSAAPAPAMVEKAKPAAKPKTSKTPGKTTAAPQKKKTTQSDISFPLSPITRQWTATDNGNPRTGKGVVNPYETTELEKEAIRRLEAWRELEQATEQIKNPKGHESGLLKFIKGDK